MGNDPNNGQTPQPEQHITDVILSEYGATALPFHTTRSGVMTSIDLSKPEGKRQYYKAMMGESMKADKFINQTLKIVNVIIAPAQAWDTETGKLDRWARTVVILENGECISFGSLGVVKSLALYCDCFSAPPWNPPAEFLLRSTPIGKNRWYELEAIQIAAESLKKGKG